MTLQLTSERVTLLKRVIRQHLQANQELQTQFLALLTNSLQSGDGGKAQAADARKKQDVVNRAVQMLIKSTAFASALKPLLRHDRRAYVHLRVLGGRAFLDHLHHLESPNEGQIYLSVSFQKQRFTSSRVCCDLDPAVDASFLLELGSQLDDDLQQLVHVTDRVHIIALRRTPDGRRTVIGGCRLDWRQVLTTEHVSVSAKLIETDGTSEVPTGVLDLQLSRLPQLKHFLGDEVLQRQLKAERLQEADALSHFASYASEWRDDFLRLRASHADRHVEVLACSENGDVLPVCAFLQPLRGGRLIGSPLAAARFVSLLEIEPESEAEKGGPKVWHTTHTFLARGYGSVEDHAVLLCNLLLGFGLDAYVIIGTIKTGPHAWVMTRTSDGDVTFWDSLTGDRYPRSDLVAMERCQYRSVGCVFNHEYFFANNQVENSARLASFDLQNGAHWSSMDPAAISNIREEPLVALQPSSLVPHREAERLEAHLKALMSGYRRDRKLPVMWDDELSHLLMPALVSYENEHLLGLSVGQDYFQQSIKAAVPVGHTFKAFPYSFKHRSATNIFKSFLQEGAFRKILGTKAEEVKMALCVRLFPHAEDVCSTWCMLAVTFRSRK